MADPRAVALREGNAGCYETYETDHAAGTPTIVFDATKAGGSSQVGLAVTIGAGGIISLTLDGSHVLGKLIKVETDGFANVQIGGYATLPGGASASLTVGKRIVGALGASSAKGYIREVATATAAELGVQNGFIEDATTTTAVLVRF